jgi:hypothetical protein
MCHNKFRADIKAVTTKNSKVLAKQEDEPRLQTPYSPSLASSNFHFLSSLKDTLRRRRFADDELKHSNPTLQQRVVSDRRRASQAEVEKLCC